MCLITRIKQYRCKQIINVILLSGMALLLILLQGCGGGGGSNGAKGSINGTVKNSEGTRLPGVTVSSGGKSTTTDNDGEFTLENVPVGTQIVSASLNGYFNDGRGSASVQVVEEKTTNVSGLILVATANGEIFIWHLDESSSDYDAPKQKQLGGTIYYDSLFATNWDYGVNYPATAIYSIGRRYSRFKATVGAADDESDLNAQIVFKVIGDGTILYQSEPMKVRVIDNVDVDVSNILTLQLQVDRVAGTGSSDPDIVWGDARLTTK